MNNKGFTLIELILSISLSMLIGACIFNVLIFNKNIFNMTSSAIEIQQQSQFLKEFIEDKLYISSGIDSIVDINGKTIKYEDFKEGSINEVIFTISNINQSIYWDKMKGKVFYRKNMSYNGYEIGDYVEGIRIKKVNNGRGIHVYIRTKRKGKDLQSDFLVYFRNYNTVLN